ncbi:MAG TPA: TlpA disulfide reductase family protein [Pyrinomonadaceae bacterium]|jgi:thiol-disulfide isomerase/thioredoxin
MKNLSKTLGLLIALSIVFSAFSACSNTANSQKDSGTEKTTADNTANAGSNTVSESKSSDYPLAPAAVLSSDIKGVNGNVFKVEDLKGKVLLLNMWATWCGPCREEMPHLVAMEDEFKAKDFKVIGLNIDEEPIEKIQPFAEKMKLNYELAWADENLYRGLLKVSKFDGIPQSFLLDREGHLRGVFLGGSEKVIRQMRENVEKVVNE